MLKRTMLAGLAGILALAALSTPASSAGAAATMMSLLGIVQARTIAGWRQAVPSQRLYPGMVIRTGDRSRSDVRYDDGSFVRLGARTLISIRDVRNLSLLRGKTLIQKKPAGQQFQVRTPVAHATVLGTELFISHNEANVSHVTTLDGLVQVEDSSGHMETVHPGEWVEISPDKPMEKPSKFDWNELRRTEKFLLDQDFVPAPNEALDDEEWR